MSQLKDWGLPVKKDNIPEELKVQDRWVCYKATPRAKGKVNKIPKKPINPLSNASTKNKSDWGTFNEAYNAYENTDLNGIGFVITNLSNCIFMDLDNCVSSKNEIKPWAQEIITKANSYTELSPSGRGLRIILKGKLPGVDFNNHKQGVEMYGGSSSRYLTITGHRIINSPKNLRKVNQKNISSIYNQYKTSASKTTNKTVPIPNIDSIKSFKDIKRLGLHKHIEDYLLNEDASAYGDDCSAALMGAAKTLYNMDLTDSEVISILSNSVGAMNTAARRGGGDKDNCIDWIWKYTCLKARNPGQAESQEIAPAVVQTEITDSSIPNSKMFNPRGILSLIYNYILQSCIYPQPIFALAATISIASLLIGNKYKTADGIYGNLYIFSIGGTGSGKDAPQKVAKKIAQECNLHFHVADGIGSGPGIEDYLECMDNPLALFLIDEIGRMLQKLSKPNGDEHGVISTLLKLYTATSSFYGLRVKAGKEHKIISNPYTCLHGSTTSGAIESSLSSTDTEAGWIGRMLFFNSKELRPQKKDINPHPDDLLEISKFSQNISLMKDKNNVPYNDAAKKLFNTYTEKTDEYLRSKNIHPIERSSSVRMVEMAKKLALLSAVGRNPKKPMINVRDARWAILVVENSHSYVKNTLVEKIESSVIDTPESRLVKHLLEITRNAGTYRDSQFKPATSKGFIPLRLAMKKLKCTKRQLAQVEEALLMSGEIAVGALTKKIHGVNVEKAYYIPDK